MRPLPSEYASAQTAQFLCKVILISDVSQFCDLDQGAVNLG
jgi:hypothetical protein